MLGSELGTDGQGLQVRDGELPEQGKSEAGENETSSRELVRV